MLLKRIFVVSAFFVPVLLFAGSSEPTDTLTRLEKAIGEVTVTAIKQAADLTLHPVAGTVVNRAQVERLNIASVRGVSELAPNVYMPQYGSRMTSSIYVRGIGARIDQPVVGLNIDNVPFLNKDNYDFDIPDIARMEIIRGAQSTLYGRNTMGGLINIYTISPLSYQGTRVLAEAGKGNLYRAALSHYRKFSPVLGMSLSGDFHYFGGIRKNEYNGCHADSDKGGSLRWKTDWKPNSRLSLENAAWVTISRSGGYPYAYEGSGEINYNDTCFYQRNSFADGLTLKYRGDSWSVSSITSAQYIDDNMTLDQDFLPKDYFTLTQKRKEWALTQDFIARGRVGANYRWLGGAFAFYKHTSMNAPVTFKGYGISQLIEGKRNEINPDYPIKWDDEEFLLGSSFTMPTWGAALYHESELKIGKWNFSAGIRLDYERVGLRYHSSANSSYTVYNATDLSNIKVFSKEPIDINDRGKMHKSFVEVLPKVSVSYALPMPSRSNVYVSVGKGYKSGGYNTQMFSDVLQQRVMGLMGLGMKYDVDDIVGYNPEKSWNYEAGAHIVCAGGKVLTDVALFYIDCRDQQVTTFPDGTTTGRITTNAGKTESYGAEFQVSYLPSSHWLMNVSYGYTHATFKEFFNGMQDFSDKRVPYAPANTFFASVTYTHPVNRFIDEMVFNINLRGAGNIYWDEENSRRQNAYALLGASVSAKRGYATIELWGKNLADSKYNVFSFKSIGNTFFQRGMPLTWGVTLRLDLATNRM